MTLENHPASFDSISRSAGAADVPPSSWTHEDVRYDIVPNGHGWDVIAGELLLGCLERDVLERQSAPHWRISDPRHDGFGVGASWGDWEDALMALIDYRDRN